MIAADNLFEFSLADYVAFWRAKPEGARSPCTGSPTPASRTSTASSSSTATTASSGSRRSPSTRAATSSRPPPTSSRADHLALIDRYLDEGNAPDPPGRFLTWLCEREPVYGFRFGEAWLDIGELPTSCTRPTTATAAAAGLPLRAEYAPEP